MADDQRSSNGSSPTTVTSRWEWVAGVVSALLITGLVGFLLWDSRSHGEGHPRIEIVVDTVARVSEGHVVEFTATNRSQTTASGLTITGELLQDTTVVESSSVTVDYLPPGGSRTGGFFFSENPADYTLEIAADGYVAP